MEFPALLLPAFYNFSCSPEGVPYNTDLPVIYKPEDPSIFYNMQTEPYRRVWNFNDTCFNNWSWDLDLSTYMLPFLFKDVRIAGTFTNVSNNARAVGIDNGTQYVLQINNSCAYMFKTDSGYSEFGSSEWVRASRTDPNNSSGGQASSGVLTLSPSGGSGKSWESFWQARDKFYGSFQSKYGIASFTLRQN